MEVLQRKTLIPHCCPHLQDTLLDDETSGMDQDLATPGFDAIETDVDRASSRRSGRNLARIL